MLKAALALHQKSRLDEAAIEYRKILTQNPNNSEALRLLGVLEAQRNDLTTALEFLDRALAIQPGYAEAYNDRGVTLRALKRFDAALASYDRALAIRPDLAEAHNNRGNVLRELKRYDEALASFDHALAIRPHYSDGHNNRGTVLQELKRYDEALASYDRALAIRPDYADGHNNRGTVLQELKRYDEALASHDHALTIWPDFAEAHNNRGIVLRELKRFDEALASYDRALKIRPDYTECHNSRGIVLQELTRFDEALANFDNAIAIQPGHAEFRYNRGTLKCRLGRLQEGWPDYEWRWGLKSSPSPKPQIAAAEWQGENINGRSILIYFEQGRGDILQFVRYLPMLAERGARVVFLVPAEFIRLMGSMSAQITLIGSLPEESFDFQCALLSLPLRFGTDVQSIPGDVPYLRAEPDLVRLWKTRIAENDFKIGIAWQGSPQSDTGRDIPLVEFASLFGLSGTRLISLQKHYGLEQLAGLPPSSRIETLREDFDGGPDAFIDTAAVMQSLDLIITSDTSIAHLAGALGRPTWLALKHLPEWRWMLDRSDSPWYPTMRLFRQEAPGDWNSVFVKIAKELRSLLG